MRKISVIAAAAAVLLSAACGGKGTDLSKPSTSPAPSQAVSAAPDADTDEKEQGSVTERTNAPESENEADETAETADNGDAQDGGEESGGNGGSAGQDSISIINGSSEAFYAVYLSSSADGNPGENIIGDTPLNEGEEIELPFANAPDGELTIVVEDKNGARYSAGGISLANGLTIELRLNGGVLEAVTV